MAASLIKILIASVALSGCVAGEAVMQETTRGLARTAVDAAAMRYAPGVPVKPYTDCIINNATTAELVELARVAGAAGTGGAGQELAGRAWPVVSTVASRPETTQCFLSALTASDLLTAQGLLTGGL